MIKTKKNKGITLIALVITIIILLILASVSINLLINDGIIEKSQLAKQLYQNAQDEEKEKLDNINNSIDNFDNFEIVSNREDENHNSKTLWTGKLYAETKMDLDMTNYDYIELFILTNHHTNIVKMDLTQKVVTNYISGYDYVSSFMNANTIQNSTTVYYDIEEIAVSSNKDNIYFYKNAFITENSQKLSIWANENIYIYRIIGGKYN